MRIAFRFSSRKFYDIVEQQNIEIMPEVPEDAVLSKFLSKLQTADKGRLQKRSSKFQKQTQPKLNYTELLNGSPHGSVQNFIHRNHELTLVSMNYFRINEQKFHKLLYSSKPDVLIIQRRPQYHVHDFQLIAKGSDDVFSDYQYLKGLMFTPQTIKTESPSYRPMVNALNKAKDDGLQQMSGKQILQEKGFETCRKYCSAYQTQMVFGQMPMRAYRQWIANTHTLMELQQIFKVVCQRLPRYRNISFNPYQMATLIYPDIFIKINDHYMATVIEMMIATKKYKKIVGVFGIVENEAVKHILQTNQALRPIIQSIIAPAPKGSIVRDIQNLQIIEKQIILDVMFFGRRILDIKTQMFHTTNAAIEKYCKDVDKKTMMQFRYDKTLQYLKIMEDKQREGEQEIKKEFVRQTLRENKK